MKKIFPWQIVGFIFVSLTGTLLHFLYNWLNKSVWVAPFSSINESTWEHMKLLFWPIFIFAIIQSFFCGHINGYWCVKQRSIFLGLILIPVIFYTYNGVVGRSPDWINITIFFISAAAAFIYENKQFKAVSTRYKSKFIAIALLLSVAAMFIIFTFATPEIGIFNPPEGL